MYKILGFLALLCLPFQAQADGLLTQPGWFYNGFGTTLNLNNCTLGTDNFCVNGTTSVGNVNVTSATIPANGIYLSAANTLEIATNTSPRIAISTTSFTSNNASGFQMGMGATTCTGTLALTPNRSGSTNGYSGDGTKDCLVLSGVDTFDFAVAGFTAKGTIPTVTGTGTPTIVTGSTDSSGEVTGGTLATSIVITFSATKTNAPFCTISPQTLVAAFAYTISTTAITVTMTATTGQKIDYICMQH